MPDNSYVRREIQLVLDMGPEHEEDWFRLTVSGAATSKHLNITPSQLAAIRDLLAPADPPTPTPLTEFHAFNANTNEWVDLRTLDADDLHWWERAAGEAGDVLCVNTIQKIRSQRDATT